MVTVIADDGYGGSNSTAEITVTIYVTDLDEAPMIMDKADSEAMGEQSVTYEENDDKAVLRLSATDPEGVTPIVWSILEDAGGNQDLGIVTDPEGDDDVDDPDVADHDSFDIKDGVLTFKSPPSYEADSASGDADDAKTYRVVVQASDGGATNKLSWFKVAVTVTDEEEGGTVSWTVDPNGNDGHTPDHPEADAVPGRASLMASVTDGDGDAEYRQVAVVQVVEQDFDGHGDRRRRPRPHTSRRTPERPRRRWQRRRQVHSREGDLHVDGGSEETATLASDYPVQAIRVEANTVPAFSSTAISRRVTEGASGRNVGAPVTATDADSDVLNYTTLAAVATTGPVTQIDQKTGQITTALGSGLLEDDAPPKDVDGTVNDT